MKHVIIPWNYEPRRHRTYIERLTYVQFTTCVYYEAGWPCKKMHIFFKNKIRTRPCTTITAKSPNKITKTRVYRPYKGRRRLCFYTSHRNVAQYLEKLLSIQGKCSVKHVANIAWSCGFKMDVINSETPQVKRSSSDQVVTEVCWWRHKIPFLFQTLVEFAYRIFIRLSSNFRDFTTVHATSTSGVTILIFRQYYLTISARMLFQYIRCPQKHDYFYSGPNMLVKLTGLGYTDWNHSSGF